MTGDLPNVPDWIEEKIQVRSRRDTQDHHIVDEFQQTNRPFLTVSALAGPLGMSTEGVRERLKNLEELEILDSCPGANGDLYWIRDSRSDWPIPPDVEVEPIEDDEMTVSELLSQRHVQYGIVAVAGGLAESILVTAFLVVVVADIAVPNDIGSIFLFAVLATALVSVAFGLLAVGDWIWSRRRAEEQEA